MIKNFIIKQMVRSQLKGIPKEQQDVIIDMVEKNPAFFENIAKEVKEKVDGGKDQMAATMEVMSKHRTELQKLMQK
jgi:hypothetical protein